MNNKNQKRYINSKAYHNNKELIKEEMLRKIKIASKKAADKKRGTRLSEEQKEKMRGIPKTYKSEETKMKMKLSSKDRWLSEDYKNKMVQIIKNHWNSEKGLLRKQKLSERCSGIKNSKIGEKLRGIPKSESVKKAISEANSKSLVYKGTRYKSLKEACTINNMTGYKLKKDPSFEYI
jgi:hypothetical protein